VGEESTKKGYTGEKENKTEKRGAGEPQAKNKKRALSYRASSQAKMH
jgi:hypothetical protein